MNSVFYPRKIYPDLQEHLKSRHITVITGMRRTGKTTLVSRLLSEVESDNKVFFDLQKVNNQELFGQKNYDNILLELRRQGLKIDKRLYIGLDEIQLIPDLAGVMKYLYDHYDIKFIVTGSSSYYLKNLFTESLAGRKKIFELYPLDFGEFLRFKEVRFTGSDFIRRQFDDAEYDRLRAYYDEFIEFGGFPEVALMPSIREKKDLLNDLISSYINIDIKSLSDFRDSSNVYNLVKMLAARVGTKIDYSKLSRLTGISRTTVLNYINLFEQTYLISRVPVHTSNPDREIVKARKLYFADAGLLTVLADIDSGAKFENTVFSQLRHHGHVSYFSLKSGREIDFILNGQTALECKETPTVFDKKELADMAQKAGVGSNRLIGRFKSPSFADYIWGGGIT